MILNRLRISGFTSYTEKHPAEIDFSDIQLACISGSNGAGKSSLLDAITYALYGKARRSDEAIINSSSKKTEVTLDFTYEGQAYRVIRSLQRGKTAQVEFFLLEAQEGALSQPIKVLTEQTLRETDARIESTLRLDYQTFINASFFLQGKADSFATQKPIDRKKILSSILGLDQWELYRERARVLMGERQQDISRWQQKLSEIQSELAEEPLRKANLESLEAQAGMLRAERNQAQAVVDKLHAEARRLEEQQRLVDLLAEQMQRSQRNQEQLIKQLDEKQKQLDRLHQQLSNADAIAADFQEYQAVQAQLTELEAQAEKFRPLESALQNLHAQLKVKQAELENDLRHLLAEEQQLESEFRDTPTLRQRLEALNQQEEAFSAKRERLTGISQKTTELQEDYNRLQKENGELTARGNDLNERLAQLQQVTGAICPLCGQPLAAHDRQRLADEIQQELEHMRQAYQTNREALRANEAERLALEAEEKGIRKEETALQSLIREKAGLSEKLQRLTEKKEAWSKDGAARLLALQRTLSEASFLPELRAQIEERQNELVRLGYDPVLHAEMRQKEQQLRFAVGALHQLELAQASVSQTEESVKELESSLQKQEDELAQASARHAQAAERLAAELAGLPDLKSAEEQLMQLTEKLAEVQRRVGAAEQLVRVLDTLRDQQTRAIQEKQTVEAELGRLKVLERAFSKDGVPAMLIDQALPELESHANEILGQLTDYTLSVKFNSQRAYKDPKRSDKKETLDILISDGFSTREYETYSGGEAFKVNFSIRLALAQVLAKRANARLKTIIIDEGFGNQDSQGRQRLLEAITRVSQQFEKILVISHIDELKDAFPSRIEVEKGPDGSRVKVFAD